MNENRDFIYKESPSQAGRIMPDGKFSTADKKELEELLKLVNISADQKKRLSDLTKKAALANKFLANERKELEKLLKRKRLKPEEEDRRDELIRLRDSKDSFTESDDAELAELSSMVQISPEQKERRDYLITERDTKNRLSVGAKTRIQEKFLSDRFGIKKDPYSKYLVKGKECEEESLRLLAKTLGIFGIRKNEERLENDYFIGTPDIITKDAVIDVKTSWDGNTFPWFAEEIPSKDYEYQLQCYMHLTGKKKAYLVYCLTNASEVMIIDECKRKLWQERIIDPSDEELEAIEDKVRSQMEFNQVPDELRVKVFEIEYDQETINKLIEKVKLARVYYARLEAEIDGKLQIKNQLK